MRSLYSRRAMLGAAGKQGENSDKKRPQRNSGGAGFCIIACGPDQSPMQTPMSRATWMIGWSTGRNLVLLAASSRGMEVI